MTQTCACVARFVQTPSDDAQVDLIDRFAWYVAKDGIQFESAIMAEEAANAGTRFKFLQDLQSPEGIYYRWRVASLVMGDTLEAWRTQPFRITVDGPWWVPPPGGGKSCVQQPGAGLFLCCASPQCAPPVFTAVPHHTVQEIKLSSTQESQRQSRSSLSRVRAAVRCVWGRAWARHAAHPARLRRQS